MKWTHHLFSMVQFFQVVILVLGGCFFIALPFAPSMRVRIADFFLFNTGPLLYVGGLLVAVGLILGIGFYFFERRVVLQVSMDPPALVEGDVIASLVKRYMEERFVGETFQIQAVVTKGGGLELISEMPSSQELEKFLPELEKEVGELLVRSLGYQRKFTFTILD